MVDMSDPNQEKQPIETRLPSNFSIPLFENRNVPCFWSTHHVKRITGYMQSRVSHNSSGGRIYVQILLNSELCIIVHSENTHDSQFVSGYTLAIHHTEIQGSEIEAV